MSCTPIFNTSQSFIQNISFPHWKPAQNPSVMTYTPIHAGWLSNIYGTILSDWLQCTRDATLRYYATDIKMCRWKIVRGFICDLVPKGTSAWFFRDFSDISVAFGLWFLCHVHSELRGLCQNRKQKTRVEFWWFSLFSMF